MASIYRDSPLELPGRSQGNEHELILMGSQRMTWVYRRSLRWVLAVGLLVAGCARAPSPPPKAVTPPKIPLSAQEQVIEAALNEFHGAPYRSGGTAPD